MLETTNRNEQDESRDLEMLIGTTNTEAALAKKLLNKLREETIKLEETNGCKQSEIRIRNNLINIMIRRFVDVMKEYQNKKLT